MSENGNAQAGDPGGWRNYRQPKDTLHPAPGQDFLDVNFVNHARAVGGIIRRPIRPPLRRGWPLPIRRRLAGYQTLIMAAEVDGMAAEVDALLKAKLDYARRASAELAGVRYE